MQSLSSILTIPTGISLLAQITLTILIGVSMNNKLKETKKVSERLDDEIMCMKCCFGANMNESCQNECGHSSISKRSQCGRPSNKHQRLFSDDEIQQVIKKEYTTGLNSRLGRYFIHPKQQFDQKLKTLRKMVETSHRPKAFMTIGQSNGPPLKTTNCSRALSWNTETGAAFCYVDGLTYMNESGLQIQGTGQYLVYMHTTFIRKKPSEMEEPIRGERIGNCMLTHMVHKSSGDSSIEILMKSTETRDCGVFIAHHRKRRGSESKTNVGFQTLHTTGIFKLKKGEHIQPFYHMPKYMKVGWTSTETFFGIFML
uniref:Tumor necrosis factor alpha n=1 Tax=Ciona intestinalis TaxID=7719 RepID=B2G3P9_CIOIN|nr:tumor necrosis factor alpha [Ciona intestinalis]CAQ42487.1 tumor necrosis factor alpha precursor [Ciona intestinalis]|eukprot:NP_001121579.1 tumor necrosis factor alpha [Ciona intestinalis]